IMTKNFDDLSRSIKAGWSDDAKRLYEAAVSQFSNEMKAQSRIGAQFAAARKVRGLTQIELSKITGIQQAEISRIENGAGNPTATTLLRITEALGHRIELTPA